MYRHEGCSWGGTQHGHQRFVAPFSRLHTYQRSRQLTWKIRMIFNIHHTVEDDLKGKVRPQVPGRSACTTAIDTVQGCAVCLAESVTEAGRSCGGIYLCSRDGCRAAGPACC